MASLQTSTMLSSSLKRASAAISVPKLPRVPFSLPKIPTTTTTKLVQEFNGAVHTVIPAEKDVYNDLYHPKETKATIQLYAILEAVADRVEMHNNIGEQRQNWNNLLLNSINMITLTAATMVGVATVSDASAPILALKLSSTLLFSAATGMSLIMNKLQPSQLAEEQRNSTRLFKQLQTQIQNTLTLGNPTEEDVKSAMEKVLALDKAYPLPLLGAMLEKFPTKFEPAVWWPKSHQLQRKVVKSQAGIKLLSKNAEKKRNNNNGWSEELEMEMREILEVVKRKDMEDYERLGNLVLKINKTLAISGPLLTGIAALGSAFVSHGSPWAAILAVTAGSLATSINAFEHGGQVGMVFEMYRNCGGFFKLLQETIESSLEERDHEKRENGELLEMKVAMQLGRSVSQLRELASKSASYGMEGIAMDEFASKLF